MYAVPKPTVPACSLNRCEIGALRRTPHGMTRGMCREWLDPCLNQNQHQQMTGTYDWLFRQCPRALVSGRQVVRVLEMSAATNLEDKIIQTLYPSLTQYLVYFILLPKRKRMLLLSPGSWPTLNLSATFDDKLSHSFKQKNFSLLIEQILLTFM